MLNCHQSCQNIGNLVFIFVRPKLVFQSFFSQTYRASLNNPYYICTILYISINMLKKRLSMFFFKYIGHDQVTSMLFCD